ADRRSSSSAARSNAAVPLPRPFMSGLTSLHERICARLAISARICRRAVISSIALANQIVQVSTDAKARPTITALTTISAAMNIPQGDRPRGNFSAMRGEIAEDAAGCSTEGAGVPGAGVDCGVVAAAGSAADGEAGGVCAKTVADRTRLTATAAAATTARHL